MKKSRFTEEQVVRILSKGDKGDKTITEVCREHGISKPTFCNWRNGFGEWGLTRFENTAGSSRRTPG